MKKYDRIKLTLMIALPLFIAYEYVSRLGLIAFVLLFIGAFSGSIITYILTRGKRK